MSGFRKNDSDEHGSLPHRKTDGKGEQEGKTDEKPLPPRNLWVSRYDDPPDVDCGDALNE